MNTEKKMNGSMRRIAAFGAGVVMSLATMANVEAGTDTANGGSGGRYHSQVSEFPVQPAPIWCGSAAGYLRDIQAWSRMARNIHEARFELVEGLRRLLASYSRESFEIDPLTYSLIARAVQVDQVFGGATTNSDEGRRSTQSAVILLDHLVSAAIRVNQQFDVPRYVPFYNRYRDNCKGGWCGYPYPAVGYPDEPFYTDYVSAAKEVLNELFSPAIRSQPNRGSVLDAMGDDRTELRVLDHVISWVVSDFHPDVFRRGFECLNSRLIVVHEKLARHLSGPGVDPWRDRQMREYVVGSLFQVRDELNRRSNRCYRR